MIEKLQNYNSIYSEWKSLGKTAEAARLLTMQQLTALELIVNDDESWHKLLEIAAAGRKEDAWLAADWPAGFDELVLCVPLCKLVDWECSKCIVGMKQNNISCAHDDSLFGRVGELVIGNEREELKKHIENIRKILEPESVYKWNMDKLEVEKL
jgi:hypothetical protein